MSYAPQRTRNGALADGMTDGTYKKLVRDRGGFVEETTQMARELLDPATIAYQEAYLQHMPDGTDRYVTGDVRYRSRMKHQS